MGSEREEKRIEIPGVNIQYPWSRLILDGKKKIETRHYSLPLKYIGKELALIETPGPEGRKLGIETKIIGIIKVNRCFVYESLLNWKKDFDKHLVDEQDVDFKFSEERKKWGWELELIRKLEPQAPPKVRGIKYTKSCYIEY